MGTSSSKQTVKYPDPFFDPSKQQFPENIKDILSLVPYFFYSDPIIGSVISKLATYPITRLMYESKTESIKRRWKDIFEKQLDIEFFLEEAGLDYFAYGNCFVSLHLPYTRVLVCPSCRKKANLRKTKWTWKSFKFIYDCPACEFSGEGKIVDIPNKNIKDLNIIRWDCRFINIRLNSLTGKREYRYAIPPKDKERIEKGEKDFIEEVPEIFIQAVKESKEVVFIPDSLFHLRRPSLSGPSMEWGKPLIIHIFQRIFFVNVLRHAQLAIAQEHIIPFDILYPSAATGVDPYTQMNLANWRSSVESEYENWRRDPNYKAIMPIPIGTSRVGGDGKMLMTSPEINIAQDEMCVGMNVPRELIFGGLTWSGSNVSLRMLENLFLAHRRQLMKLLHWMHDKISLYFNVQACEMKFMDFVMADDQQRKQTAIQMNQAGKISNETLCDEMNYSYSEEHERMRAESRKNMDLQTEQLKAQAEAEAEAEKVRMKAQMEMQQMGLGVPEGEEPAQKKNEPGSLDMGKQISIIVNHIKKLTKNERVAALSQVKQNTPKIFNEVRDRLTTEIQNKNKARRRKVVTEKPLPEQRPPRREGQ